MERRQFVRIEEFGCLGMIPIILAGAPPALPYLLPCFVEHGFIRGVFPLLSG
jgi:hypothetical protein